MDDRCAPRSNASSRALQATPEPAGVGAERRRVTACAETRSVPVGHDAWPRRPAAVSRRRGGVPGGAVRLAEEGADIIGFDICADDPWVEYPLASRDDLDETVKFVEKTRRGIHAEVADVRNTEAVAKSSTPA